MIPVTTLRPFTRMLMTIGQIPTSYLITISYEEQLLWLCNFLEKEVIPALNNNAEAVKEVQELYTELKSYVDNYFENLDVQEEINNKLDKMAEGGQLADIIAQYLGLAGVLAYDTISNMASATNITEGSICRTLGETTYNDGKGAFYKVRTITSSDVIDGVNIVALSASNTLIAERMPDYRMNQLETRVSNIEDEISEKVVFFGDSYARGSLGSGGTTTSWCERVANMMGLSSNDYYADGISGGAFYNGTLNDGFNTFLANIPIIFRNKTTKVVIGAGANDFVIPSATSNLENNIHSLMNVIKTNFPKAKIYVCFIGYKNILTDVFATVRFNLLSNIITKYATCVDDGAVFANNIGYILHDSTLVNPDDGTHPTEDGYKLISKAIYNFIESGRSFIKPLSIGYNITPGTDITINQSNTISMCDEVTIWNSKEFTITSENGISSNNAGVITIGNFDNPPFVRPNSSTTQIASGSALVTYTNNTTAVLSIDLRMGYTGQAYIVFDKQESNIISIRCRALSGINPTVYM